MVAQDGADLLADGLQRVELAARVGDDHGDVAPAQPAQTLLIERPEVLAVEADAAALDAPRRRDELHDAAREHGLAGPRLADQAQHLARRHLEVDAAQHLLWLEAVAWE